MPECAPAVPACLTIESAAEEVARLEAAPDPERIDALTEAIVTTPWQSGEERDLAQRLIFRLHFALLPLSAELADELAAALSSAVT